MFTYLQSLTDFSFRTSTYLSERSYRLHTLLYTVLLVLPLYAIGQTNTNSIQLNGAKDQFITLQNSEAVLSSSNFTLEAWVYASDWQNAFYRSTLFCTEDPETLNGFVLRGGGNQPNGFLNMASMTSERQIRVISPAMLVPNHWQHIAAVVDKRTVTLYVNGQLVAQSVLASDYIPSKKPIRLGAAYYPERGLFGAIDEVRIWNRSRTATEILRDRAVSLKGNEPGLVAYFPFDDKAGNVLTNKAKSAITADYAAGGLPTLGRNYTLADNDVGVEQIEGPDVFTARLGPSRIQISVQNHGNKTVRQIPLVYRLNGKEVLRDTLHKPLAPGERYLHKTSVPVFCTPTDISTLTVYTALPTDGWVKNDTATAVYRPTQSGAGRNTVVVLDSVLHNYGRTVDSISHSQFHANRVILPQDNARYSRILLHINLSCPSGGCNHEDTIGQLFLIKNGRWDELGRFITPYGIGCGPWAIDVTDFKSELTGSCLLQSYIEVWWMKGWNLSVSLEFIEGGANQLPYQKLTPLWKHDYFVYGDKKYTQKLPAITYQPSLKARVVTFRQTITGHGQGNTDNAGEFARKTHQLVIKQLNRPDSLVLKHILWKDDCAQNPCTRQKGSYTYSRAGWCPGQDVRPWNVNLPIQLTQQQPITLEYRLQPYQNLKNTGYDDGMHIEANYRFQSYLIEKSDSLAGFITYHNVTCQSVTVVDSQVTVDLSNTGTEPITQLTLHYFVDGKRWATETKLTGFILKPNETKKLTFTKRLPTEGVKNLSVVADANGDENGNDDVATLALDKTVQLKN